jgi:hypothetical protein
MDDSYIQTKMKGFVERNVTNTWRNLGLHVYEGVAKSFRTKSIKKQVSAAINTRWKATQSVMAAKQTRLTHKIAIQLQLLAESSTICSSCSKRPFRKLLDTPSYSFLSFTCNNEFSALTDWPLLKENSTVYVQLSQLSKQFHQVGINLTRYNNRRIFRQKYLDNLIN